MEEEKRGDSAVKELVDRIVGNCMARIPREVVVHLGNAQKEVLLALRSLTDRLIRQTEDRVKKDEEYREKKL